MEVGWWGLCFLFYGMLLDWFATLWLTQNPPTLLNLPQPKAKNAKKAPNPRTPLDCLHCHPQTKTAASVTSTADPELVPAYRQTKSKRGRPKKINTEGYACPNPKCLYFGCTDAALHALVGDGCHGKERQIQTF